MDPMKKIVVPLRKQRNPLVVPALFRKAGRHGDGRRELRRQALERDLTRDPDQ